MLVKACARGLPQPPPATFKRPHSPGAAGMLGANLKLTAALCDARQLFCPCLDMVVRCRMPALAQARAGEVCCCCSYQAAPRCLHGCMTLFIGGELAESSLSFTTCPSQAHGFSTTAAHVPYLNQPGCTHGEAELSGWVESLSLLRGRLPSITSTNVRGKAPSWRVPLLC